MWCYSRPSFLITAYIMIIWNWKYAPNVPLLYCLPYFCCFLTGPMYFLVMVLLLRRTWNWWVAWSNQIEMALVPLKKILPSGPNPNVQTTLQPGWHMPTQTHPEGPNLPSKQGKIFVQHHSCVVPTFLSPNFTIHLSHQIFYLMHGALNIDK